ncbi:hypothetical protein [Clostridium botulinum]|nr:hypothetical protein [Clostridium botulinum]
MGKLLIYAEQKDKLDRNIAEETKRLYSEGLDYKTAFEKAKEIYLKGV